MKSGRLRQLFLQKYNNLSVQYKLVVVSFCCIGVALLLLTMLLIFLFNNSTHQNLEERMLNTIDYSCVLIEKEQQYLYGIAEYYAISPEVQELLHRDVAEETAAPDSQILDMVKARMYVLSTVFYNADGEPVEWMSIDGSKRPLSQTGEDTPYYQLMHGGVSQQWQYITDHDPSFMELDNSPKLCLWKLIKDNKSMRPLGVVAISIDTRKLISSGSVPTSLYNSILVLDGNGDIAFRDVTNPYSPSEEANREMIAQIRQRGDKRGVTRCRLDGKEYRVAYSRLASTDLFIVLPNEYEFFVWNQNTVAIYVLISILISLLLTLPMLFIGSRWVVRPLRKLYNSMKDFMNGNEYSQVCLSYDDEIGKLGKLFNQMVVQNRELIENNYKSKIREQTAELDMQQAQINPHFLYNMLHAIQWMALKQHEQKIANVAYALSQFFRFSLSRGASVITLAQEFELVRYYLYLQNFRFPDMIEYTIDVDNSLQTAKVPKFIIQPLLENSIIHGMKDHTTVLHLSIRCATNAQRDRLIIEILDDGIGIDPQILPLLPCRTPEGNTTKSGSRYALRNIDQRLDLMYHHDYQFRFFNNPTGGAGVYIETPLVFLTPEDTAPPASPTTNAERSGSHA